MSAPDGFRRVAPLAGLRERRGLRVMLGEHPIVLWRVEGLVYAIDGFCPHMHVPTMHIAQLDRTNLICPMHGWTFAVEDGREIEGNGRIRTFRVHVEGSEVYVEEPSSSW